MCFTIYSITSTDKSNLCKDSKKKYVCFTSDNAKIAQVNLGHYTSLDFIPTLSSLSTGYCAVAANILKDFIMPIYEMRTRSLLPPHIGNALAKVAGK